METEPPSDPGASAPPPHAEAGTLDLQHSGQRPLRQELHLLPQTPEAPLLLADLPALWTARRLAARDAVCAEAPRAEVMATVQRDGLPQPLQADGAGGELPRHCGPGPQAQLQLGERRVRPGGAEQAVGSSVWGAGRAGQEFGGRGGGLPARPRPARSSLTCTPEPGTPGGRQQNSGDSAPSREKPGWSHRVSMGKLPH